MNISQIFIAIAIVVLAVIAVLVFFVKKNRKEKSLTPLASLAFGFVLAGILFGENKSVGYGLMGIGVLFAVADIFNKSRKKQLRNTK